MFLLQIRISFHFLLLLLIIVGESFFSKTSVWGQRMDLADSLHEKNDVLEQNKSENETFGQNPFRMVEYYPQVGTEVSANQAFTNPKTNSSFDSEAGDSIPGDSSGDTFFSTPPNEADTLFFDERSSFTDTNKSSSTLLREPPQSRKSCFQKVTFEQSFSGSGGSDAFSVLHTDFSAMFALPGPGGGIFLLSPLFAFDHFCEMPNIPLEDNFYRVGVNVTWMKELNEFWRVMLFSSPTYSSDFQAGSGKAVRVPSGGMGIWTPTPHWQFLFGIVYTGIEDWAILPVCGAIWQPNEDWKIEMTLPKPRICRRFEVNSSWMKPFWLYVAGEYAGSSWAADLNGHEDLMSCHELRLMFGIERDRPKIGEADFKFEIGFSFCRELYFEDSPLEYESDIGFVEKVEIKF